MSRNDPPRHRGIHDPEHAEAERARDERIRDPYEAQRPVRTFGDDNLHAAAHPWDAAHDHAPGHLADDGRPSRRGSASTWAEQPARYGGGYRGDDPRSDDRHASAGRSAFAEQRGPRHAWDDERPGHYGRGQSNSGYDTRDDDERLRHRADHQHDAMAHRDHAGSPRARPHDSAPGRGHIGAQDDRQDTYGSEGYRQQGKRYGFDDTGDERGRAPSFRGVRPRNYVRSDERLRELINEQLTDAELDASDIEVKVSDGTVTLEGTVSHRWMKHQAEDLVDECGGINDIHNHLHVRHRPAPHGQPPAAATTATATSAAADHAGTAAGPGTTQASPLDPSSGSPPPSDANRKH